MEYRHIRQPFEPVYDPNSEILILGSFPSEKSRENGFYYGHPRNRFWKVLASVFCKEEPETVADKKKMLLDSHVAIWDVIEECDIRGSSDSSIKNVITADVPGLLNKTGIQKVFLNGKTAEKLYRKYIQSQAGIEAVVLPSTSPANAAYSLERLTEIWAEAMGKSGSKEDDAQLITYEVRVSVEDYRRFLSQSHFQEADMDACMKVWTDFYGTGVEEAKAAVKVWYRRIEGEDQREKNDSADKITAVMTIGSAYDDMIALYEAKGELLKAYAADCFAMGILRLAYGLFGERLYEREKKYPGKLRFFDEEQMKEVPELLKRMKVGEVSCNEAFAMTPQKSVVFMTEMSDEKSEDCGNICGNCLRTDCPNRQKTDSKAEAGERRKTGGAFSYGFQQIFGKEAKNIWKKD